MGKFQKLLIVTTIAIVLQACSAIDLAKNHSQQDKALKSEYLSKIRAEKEIYKKEETKLEAKQSLEFGILVAHKLKLLREFFE